MDAFNTNGKNPRSATENQREKEQPPRGKAQGVRRQLTRYKQFFRVRLLSSLLTRRARKVPLFFSHGPKSKVRRYSVLGCEALLLHSGG